jgi:hypothetical protein
MKAWKFIVTGLAVAALAIAVLALLENGKTVTVKVVAPDTQNLQSQGTASDANAAMEGLHSVQIGIQSYAVDNDDRYPEPSLVTSTNLVDSTGHPYVDNWPTNPYSGGPMQQGTGPGDFAYTAGDNTFSMTVYGENGEALLTVP